MSKEQERLFFVFAAVGILAIGGMLFAECQNGPASDVTSALSPGPQGSPVTQQPAPEATAHRLIQSFAKLTIHPMGTVSKCRGTTCDVTVADGRFSGCRSIRSLEVRAFPEEALTPGFGLLECFPPGDELSNGKWLYFVNDKRLPEQVNGSFLGAVSVVSAPNTDDDLLEAKFNRIYGPMLSNEGMGRVTERDPSSSTSSSSVRFCDGSLCHEGVAWMNRYGYHPQARMLPAMRLLDVDTVLAVRKLMRAVDKAEAELQTKESLSKIQ